MSRRILVVDDAATARAWMRRRLEVAGYDVDTAADGREGLERAVASAPDLVLLDVVMPELDGFGACRALRAHPVTQATPIILVTSQDDEQHVERGYMSGCTDYILKPVDPDELHAKVASWLGAAATAKDCA